jgi:hypothetical protein
VAALHAERVVALAAATVAARRADRLAPKVEALAAEALGALKRGDEAAARAALEKKAVAVAAAVAARRRAEANARLADALGARVERGRRQQGGGGGGR